MRKEAVVIILAVLLYSFIGIVSAGSEVHDISFTGQRVDDSTGLISFPARSYDVEAGRFLQRDPSGYIDGDNLYEYVSGNVLGATDDLGLQGSLGRLLFGERVLKPFPTKPIIIKPTNAPYISPLGIGESGGIRKRGRPYIYGDNPLAYYHEHYPGVTRGELRKARPGLYTRLSKEGLLDEVPLAGRRSKFGDDALAYYHQHFPGMTLGQIAREHPGFYNRLWKDRLIDKIPRGKRSGNPISREATLSEYKEFRTNNPGLTRSQIPKGLYERLRKFGLLDEVPLAIDRPIFRGDPVGYYKKHYSGLSRGQLRLENRRLYEQLWREGLLGEVPLK
jgi:RHS repeat-associated protein